MSGLDLGACIAISMGFILLRSNIPFTKADLAIPPEPRKKIAVLGYGLLLLGAGILLFAFHFSR